MMWGARPRTRSAGGADPSDAERCNQQGSDLLHAHGGIAVGVVAGDIFIKP